MDDSMNQVKSVESAAKILNSEFIGFHYTAAKKNSCGFDPLVGEFQFKNLVFFHDFPSGFGNYNYMPSLKNLKK